MKYTIVYFNKTQNTEPINEEIADYDELCRRVRKLMHYNYPDYRYHWGRNIKSETSADGSCLSIKVRENDLLPYRVVFMMSVYSARNRPLSIEMLRERGNFLYTDDYYRKDKHLWHEHRNGPVAGIHKSRGYNWFRHPHTCQKSATKLQFSKVKGSLTFAAKEKTSPLPGMMSLKEDPDAGKINLKLEKLGRQRFYEKLKAEFVLN